MDEERTSGYFWRQMIEATEVWYPEHEGELVGSAEFERRDEIVRLLVKCREKITAQDSSIQTLDEFVEQNRDRAEEWLDTFYTGQQLGAVPEMVRRTLQFSKLDAATIPSEQVALYISEASRSYIHGFLISSVATARCALEQALKERLARFTSPSDPDRTLNGWIALAEQKNSVLSPSSIRPARDLASKCNKVMHSRPVRSEPAVLEILDGIRFLLTEIYSPQAE
jgi:hypothetical protein